MRPKVSVFDIDMALYEHEYIEQEGTLNKLVRAECVPGPWAAGINIVAIVLGVIFPLSFRGPYFSTRKKAPRVTKFCMGS